MKRPLKICAIAASIAVGVTMLPSVSLAYPGTTDSTDSTYESEETYDPYDNSVVDTSWFDYTDPKKEYTISTEAQLRGLASLVNEEQYLWKPNRTESFEDVTFILTRDITLTDNWTPIGLDDQITFAGTFDGKGHTIKGINVKYNAPYSGFFGHLSGTVRNLSLEGKVDSTGDYCGGVAGYLNKGGLIRNCDVNVLTYGQRNVGGVVGESRGEIFLCLNYGEVVGASMVGGIVGESRGGTVRRCGNRALVVSNGAGSFNNGTGGVAGRSVSASNLLGCYNVGDIISSNEATGGIAGYTNSSDSSIRNCYSIGIIRIEEPQVQSVSTVELGIPSEQETKDQTGSDLPVFAGGIAGYVGSQSEAIVNCYNAGNITGADYSGGIIGKVQNEQYSEQSLAFRNNYYGKGSYNGAIAADRNNKRMRVRGVATEVYNSAFGHLAGALGKAYKNDKSGEYGSQGYPVLIWQAPFQSQDSLAVLRHIDPQIQKWLHDAYLALENEQIQKGQILLQFFNMRFQSKDNAWPTEEPKDLREPHKGSGKSGKTDKKERKESARKEDDRTQENLAVYKMMNPKARHLLHDVNLAMEKEPYQQGQVLLQFFSMGSLSDENGLPEKERNDFIKMREETGAGAQE